MRFMMLVLENANGHINQDLLGKKQEKYNTNCPGSSPIRQILQMFWKIFRSISDQISNESMIYGISKQK